MRDFLRSGKTESVVTIRAPDRDDCVVYECARTSTTVRLIRVVIPNGRIQVMMTSLLDAEALPAADFAELYHRRWRIEEAFKRLKMRLALENTSGPSWLAAKQDFGAKVLADNLHSVVVLESVEQNAVPYQYKINRTYAFTCLRRCLPRWLLGEPQLTRTLLIVLARIAHNLVRFRPFVSRLLFILNSI